MINIYLNYLPDGNRYLIWGYKRMYIIYFNWFGKILLKKKRLTFLLILLNKFTAVIVDIMSWSQPTLLTITKIQGNKALGNI